MNRPITRRTFTKVGAGTVGLAAGATLMQTLAAKVFAAGDETVKIALVGCGARGTGAISQALQTKGPVKLWAMADLFAERLESSLSNLAKGEAGDYDRAAHKGFGSQIDVPPERRFTGFDAYQQAIDSGVDMVILATPPQFRPIHYEYLVKKGKHAFVEKPVAVDAPGIRRILAANKEAQEKDLKIGVGLMFRHNAHYQATVERIRAGAIGSVELMRCYFDLAFLRDTSPRPKNMSEMEYQLRNPYHFLWLNGDYHVDALTHYLDICNWIKGGHPVQAQGQGGRQYCLPTQRGDIFDHISVEYTYEDGSKMFGQNRQISGCWTSSSVHAHGCEGRADISRGRIKGAHPWQFRGADPNCYQVEHDILMEAIRQNKPHNEVEYGATSTMTAIMGRMASYSGQLIDWDTAFNSTLKLGPEKYAFDAPAPVSPNDAEGNYPTALPGITKAF